MTKSQRFVAWICNSALLQDELLGDRIHKQLLTRAAPLFITMSRNSIFTIQDLTFLFQRGQGKYFKKRKRAMHRVNGKHCSYRHSDFY